MEENVGKLRTKYKNGFILKSVLILKKKNSQKLQNASKLSRFYKFWKALDRLMRKISVNFPLMLEKLVVIPDLVFR